MDWLAAVLALVRAVAAISEYLASQKLLDAGKAEAINEGLKQTLENVSKADAVKKEISDNPDGDFVVRVRKKYTRE